MCNCNTAKSQPAASKTTYKVETAGMVKEFTDENEARVFATIHNGRLTIKSK